MIHPPVQTSSRAIFDRFSSMGDDKWLAALIESVESPILGGIPMPSFPASETQISIHGHSGAQSLRETYRFYSEIKAYARFAGRPVGPERTLLDFGSGWGRIARFFMKDILPENLFGAEPHPERVVMARACNPYLSFTQSSYLPPLPFGEASIDFIVSFSVFSHLDEFMFRRWMDEFRRVLKPGGLILATTQGTYFFKMCEDARARIAAGQNVDHPWHIGLANSFKDVACERKRYDLGEFLFAASGGKPPREGARYGETIVPPNFVKRELEGKLHLIDFFEDLERLPQALMVLQKPVHP